MADLVTHLCSALLPGLWLSRPQRTALALGVTLPDAVARAPGLALDLVRRAGVAVPLDLDAPLSVAHMPIGALGLALVLGGLVAPEQRGLATRWLVAGSALHLGVDLLQDHHGQGYRVLFPLTTWRFELGCVGSEATVPWAPWLALATAAAWAARWASRRRTVDRCRPRSGRNAE